MRAGLPGTLIVFFLILSVPALAQADTSLIRKSVEYMNSKKFKADLQLFVVTDTESQLKKIGGSKKADKQYRQFRQENMRYWISSSCFAYDDRYFIPVPSSRISPDSLSFLKFDTVAFKKSPEYCANATVLEPFILAEDIIEMRMFRGSKTNIYWQGESQLLRFKFDGDRPRIIREGHLFHN